LGEFFKDSHFKNLELHSKPIVWYHFSSLHRRDHVSTFVRLVSGLVGLGMMMFGVVLALHQLHEMPAISAEGMDLLGHPDTWDQHLGVWFGAALAVAGGTIDSLCLTCFQKER
jgi:hypothetical protein